MTRIIACMLALDSVAGAEHTIASLCRFGLPLVVGIEHRVDAVGAPDTEIYQINSREGFADACNQLAGLIDADWLLLISADLELTNFDAIEITSMQAPVTAVWLRDRRGYMARSAMRLQKLWADVRWAGAVQANPVGG